MAERRPYTEYEDTYILQHYASDVHRDIAAELGRTVKSVRRRAEKLGCGRKKTIRRWSEEEDKIILASKRKPIAAIAELLGRDPSDLSKRARKLGFVSWRHPDGEPIIDNHGYRVLRYSHLGKRVLEHRAVVEGRIGRKLSSH